MPRSRQKSTSRPLKLSTTTLGHAAVTSCSISMRSSTVNRPAFDPLYATITVTSSNSVAARPMMSRCPLVTGSNDPGQTALRTAPLPSPQGVPWPGGFGPGPAARPYQSVGLAVPAVLHRLDPVRPDPGRRPGSRARPPAARPAPASRRRPGAPTTAATSAAGTSYGGSRNTTSYGPAGPAAATSRAASSATTSAPGRPTAATLPRTTSSARAVLLDQQDVRGAAGQRLQADRTGARVQVEDPCTGQTARAPQRRSSVENRASRARSEVGRVDRPGGTASRRPRATPAMTRVIPRTRPGRPDRRCSRRCARRGSGRGRRSRA